MKHRNNIPFQNLLSKIIIITTIGIIRLKATLVSIHLHLSEKNSRLAGENIVAGVNLRNKFSLVNLRSHFTRPNGGAALRVTNWKHRRSSITKVARKYLVQHDAPAHPNNYHESSIYPLCFPVPIRFPRPSQERSFDLRAFRQDVRATEGIAFRDYGQMKLPDCLVATAAF